MNPIELEKLYQIKVASKKCYNLAITYNNFIKNLPDQLSYDDHKKIAENYALAKIPYDELNTMKNNLHTYFDKYANNNDVLDNLSRITVPFVYTFDLYLEVLDLFDSIIVES